MANYEKLDGDRAKLTITAVDGAGKRRLLQPRADLPRDLQPRHAVCKFAAAPVGKRNQHSFVPPCCIKITVPLTRDGFLPWFHPVYCSAALYRAHPHASPGGLRAGPAAALSPLRGSLVAGRDCVTASRFSRVDMDQYSP